MEFSEVQEYLKTNAGKKEVKEYIKGFITTDGVKGFLDTEEGKTLIQPRIDAHFTKGLQTWKENNLDALYKVEIDKVIKEKYPEETPEQKRIKELETRAAKSDAALARAAQKEKYQKEASTKGLPVELVSYFINDDPENTKAAMLDFETVFKSLEKTAKEKVFETYKMPTDTPEKKPTGLFTEAEVGKMTMAQVMANEEKIDKSRVHWNK